MDSRLLASIPEQFHREYTRYAGKNRHLKLDFQSICWEQWVKMKTPCKTGPNIFTNNATNDRGSNKQREASVCGVAQVVPFLLPLDPSWAGEVAVHMVLVQLTIGMWWPVTNEGMCTAARLGVARLGVTVSTTLTTMRAAGIPPAATWWSLSSFTTPSSRMFSGAIFWMASTGAVLFMVSAFGLVITTFQTLGRFHPSPLLSNFLFHHK